MEQVKMHGKRLGRKIPKVAPHRDRRFRHFADYVTQVPNFELPLPSPYRDWSSWASSQLGGANMFGTMLNDELGDCTCAAIGHAIQVLTAVDGTIVTPTDSQVLAMYENSGYVPGNPATDNGWYIQAALQYWQTTGLAGHKIDAFMAVDPHNMDHVDLAFEIFGFLDIGLSLPLTAQAQNNVWSVSPRGLRGSGEPGSWGGHSIIVTKRAVSSPETAGTVLRYGGITWGQGDWRITPNFWDAYVDEAWVGFSMDWLKGVGQVSPYYHFNKTQLLADLTALQG